MDGKAATDEFIRKESETEIADVALVKLREQWEETINQEPTNFIQEGPNTENAVQLEEQCSRVVARTEFDAVHPRFREEKKPEVIEQFQSANDYYCQQCKLYFAPTVLGLQTHFKGDMVQHRPIDDCFYCGGPVYAYTFDKQRQIYHSCEDSKK